MLSIFQPPDPPDEGWCLRCNSGINRDELLSDGCLQCDDLLINDMRSLWAGRPKDENIGEAFYEIALPNGYWDAIPMPGHI